MPHLCPPPPLVHSIHPKLRWYSNRVILLRIFFHTYEVLEVLESVCRLIWIRSYEQAIDHVHNLSANIVILWPPSAPSRSHPAFLMVQKRVAIRKTGIFLYPNNGWLVHCIDVTKHSSPTVTSVFVIRQSYEFLSKEKYKTRVVVNIAAKYHLVILCVAAWSRKAREFTLFLSAKKFYFWALDRSWPFWIPFPTLTELGRMCPSNNIEMQSQWLTS